MKSKNQRHLDDKTVAKLELPAGKSDIIYWDDEIAMFGFRIRSGGTRTWVFHYNAGEVYKKLTLGNYPAMKSAAMREAASVAHAQVKLTGDPATVKTENRERAHETFGKILTEKYLPKREAKLRPGSFGEIERHLKVNLKALHDTRIDLVSKRACAEELNKLAHTKVQRNRTRASLVKFLNWCVGEAYLEINPAAFTNKDDETKRTRMLNKNELRTLWTKLEEMGDDYRDIVRLLILTGARANEIGGLARREIDLADNQIKLPEDRVKNGYDFIIPMSEPVREIIERRMKWNKDREHLFGIGEGGFSGWSKAKTALDELVKFFKPWVIHDLRRTFSSTLNAAPLSVAPHVVEACLNHVSGHAKSGVAGVYNVYEYLPEKTAALALWAEHVMATVEGRAMRPIEIVRSPEVEPRKTNVTSLAERRRKRA